MNTIDDIIKYLNDDVSNETIKSAAIIQNHIKADLKNELAEQKNDFIELFAKADPSINSIYFKKRKDLTLDQTDAIKSFKKKFNKQFNIICKIFKAHQNGRSCCGFVNYMTKNILQYFDYIGDKSFEDELIANDIKITYKNLIDENSYFSSADVMEIMIDIFNQTQEIIKNIQESKDKISDLYDTLDDNIKFDKELNPNGLKLNHFNTISNVKNTSMNSSLDEFSKFLSNLITKSTSDINQRTIVLEKNQAIDK